jgi:hypothetical protein
MNASLLKSEQFSEELYFMLMTSSLRDRVRALGARHGLHGRALRNEILSVGEPLTRRIEISMDDTGVPSVRLA